VTEDIDAVILGAHAQADNPELRRAQELGLKIYSFPEFIQELSQDKIRVVIAGSYGKTTITSMVMHVMRFLGKEFDYLVRLN
jgi:UDP-N-acetylmuramate: L-alanyl-gamma-D-glutamyl-meso-diaminopimelate ligase